MIPRLRFPEFKDEFQSISLRSIVNKPISYGIVQAGEEVPEGMPYIKSSDLNTEINLRCLSRTSEEIAFKYRRSEVKSGDIIFSLRGNLGTTRIVPDEIQVANLTQGTARISLNNSFYNHHIHYTLSSPSVQRKIAAVSKGSTFKEITLDDLRKLSLYIPNSQVEQQKIAKLFIFVDQKINLLTKKKEALETYKKGLMQKLFSQELRFKRKDGTDYPEWNNSTLDELFTSKKGKGLSLSDIADDGINKCLLYGSLYTKYNEVISRCVEFTNTIESVFANNNDLLVPASTTTSGIDLATFSCLQINDVMIGGDVTILTPLDKQDSRWWAYYLSHHKKTDIAKFAQGSTIVHLYFNHFKKLQVDYPTIEEQRKTVELLIDVDTKISWLQAQISIQLELKKGLLQQMFV